MLLIFSLCLSFKIIFNTGLKAATALFTWRDMCIEC